ncbi:MAG: NAD(P)H-hydrate epimerase, partial [Finegoldia magna]|uniref:NAD(P)H-hydrate epimerase n=2 Tax=Finegoldia TaxID=150022 RepID=UPI00290A234A
MIYVTAEQMRQIDHYTINEIGIPSIVLMENAKAQISKHILDKKFAKAYVFASVGNNGGDGLAVARDIYIAEKYVKVYVIGKLEKASTDFKINYDILKKLDVEIEFV